MNWIFYCYQAGFSVTNPQLLISVRVIGKNLKKNPFTDDTTSRVYLYKSIWSATQKFQQDLSLENLLIIEPERVFDSDEIGKNINKNKNIYNIWLYNDKITIAAPKVKYFHLQKFHARDHYEKNGTEMAPDEFAFGYCETGWMTARTLIIFFLKKKF